MNLLINPGDARPVQREHIIIALLYRGVARAKLGDLDGGIADYRGVVRIEPNHTLAMQNLTRAYLDAGRIKRAACWLRRARRVLNDEAVLREMRVEIVVRRVRMAMRRLLPGS